MFDIEYRKILSRFLALERCSGLKEKLILIKKHCLELRLYFSEFYVILLLLIISQKCNSYQNQLNYHLFHRLLLQNFGFL